MVDFLKGLYYDAGHILFGESAAERDFRNCVYILEERVKAKDAEIARLSEKLDEASRLASERFARIREFEEAAAESERGPVPPVAAPKTNGGRLRAMDDYALAAWLVGFQGKDFGEWMDWLGGYAE